MSMPAAPNTPVHRQVAKASRRLFTQALLDALVWCWSGALLVSALWFVAQPWLLPPTEAWLRWAVAGGAFVAASVLALSMAVRRAPSHVYAALELDQRFHLKERVTSSLTLTPDLEATAAGQALVADANEQVAKVDVRSRFPVRLSWTAALVPAAGLVLALIAIFYNPVVETATADTTRPKDQIKMVNATEIQQRFNNLKKPTSLKFKKEGDDADKRDEIEKLWEKLLHDPLDPTSQDKVRERLQQMVPLEEKIKDRLDDL